MASTDGKLVFLEPVKEISEKYKENYAEVRKGLEEGLKEDDDIIIYRFLRGYQFDVPAATAALNKSLRWRKENKIDEIKEKASKLEPHQFPHYDKMMRVNPQNLHHGEDKQGQPFAVAHLGHSDPGLLAQTVSEAALKEFTIYHLEYQRARIQKLSHEQGLVFRTVRLVDLSGLGSKHLNPRGLRVLRSVLSLVQDNYPEMVSNVYYVNAPWIFSTLWAMVKPWINAATLEKIRILGGDPKEELLKKFDSKQLPKSLGGECTCEDKGGCVPEPDPDAGLTKIQVPRASIHEVKIEIPPESKEPTSPSSTGTPISPPTYLITWEFRTDRHNIDFEVIFNHTRPSSGPSPPQEEIFAKQRVESSQHMIEGGWETSSTGTITFKFDNYFSWTQGKTVLYRIDVVPKVLPPSDSSEKKEEGEASSTDTSSSDGSSSSSSSTESSSSSASSTSTTETTSSTTETTS